MSSAYERFIASMDIDYEAWHEGTSYDLDALRELEPDERFRGEQILRTRAGEDWRDLEALLALGTQTARAAVVEQLRHGKPEQRLWAARFLSDDGSLAADREAAVVAGLASVDLFGGLTVALDIATEERTPAMVAALFRATLRDEGSPAFHAAARLAFIYGKAKEPFDWDLRPLFLRFNTTDRAEREAAFRDLCTLCGVDPEPYLNARA